MSDVVCETLCVGCCLSDVVVREVVLERRKEEGGGRRRTSEEVQQKNKNPTQQCGEQQFFIKSRNFQVGTHKPPY